MSADDVAAVREALTVFPSATPAKVHDARDALDRLVARLQEAESERDEFIASGEMEMRKRLAAEARETALREALELVKRLRNLGFTGLVASYWNEEADRVIARALAADEEQS